MLDRLAGKGSQQIGYILLDDILKVKAYVRRAIYGFCVARACGPSSDRGPVS